MNNPRNPYTPGQPLPVELYAIGRPVTFFHANYIEAGTVTKTTTNNGATRYDIRVITDDARVVSITATKTYHGTPGVFVTITQQEQP